MMSPTPQIMKKTVLILLASAGASFGQFVAGFGYAGIDADTQSAGLPDDVTLGVLYASFGYEIKPAQNDNVRIVPELRVGTGVSDDTILGADISVETFVSVSLRAELHQESTYVFVNPTFTSIDFEASGPGGTASATGEEFGVGVGVGYNFTETASAELYAEFYDGVTFYGVGGRFRF